VGRTESESEDIQRSVQTDREERICGNIDKGKEVESARTEVKVRRERWGARGKRKRPMLEQITTTR
jgi:hypothetical protein